MNTAATQAGDRACLTAGLVLALLALAFLTAAPARAQAGAAARPFDAGNHLYEQGAYQEALDAYRQALASGYVSGALYANMGNTHFRLDALGQAIRHYEKARRLMPDDPRLMHNLEIARARIVSPVSTLPTPIWSRWWERFVLRTGAFPFFVAGMLFYAAGGVLLGQRIWTGTRNAWHRRALAAALLAGMLLLATAFGASLDERQGRQAIVVADVAPLHPAPETTAPTELNVHEGILLDVLRRQGDWIEVRLPNGTEGWLLATATADV